MAGKGKFIYVFDDSTRIKVADSAFPYNSDTDFAFPLSKFSTDDLLKLKAQVATELENRMDLDGVVEQNLEKLKAQIRGAKGEVVAQLIRQTLDRLDIVSADEKRAKTRLEILTDEMKHRMVTEGESEKKFAGLITATYKAETVYNVGEDGWGTVYSGIVAESLEDQLADDDVVEEVAKAINIEHLNDEIMATVGELIEDMQRKVRREQDITGETFDGQKAMLDEMAEVLGSYKPEIDTEEIARNVMDALVENVRKGLVNSEAFAIIQKRLTSTTLNDLVKQGYDLPKGIESQEVRKVKIKRSK